MEKTQVIYYHENPVRPGITHIAIRAGFDRPSVIHTYRVDESASAYTPELYNDMSHDVVIVPIRSARALFKFKKVKSPYEHDYYDSRKPKTRQGRESDAGRVYVPTGREALTIAADSQGRWWPK